MKLFKINPYSVFILLKYYISILCTLFIVYNKNDANLRLINNIKQINPSKLVIG
jgi:hypothetical protein